jgi:hypothetical protein
MALAAAPPDSADGIDTEALNSLEEQALTLTLARACRMKSEEAVSWQGLVCRFSPKKLRKLKHETAQGTGLQSREQGCVCCLLFCCLCR